LTFGHSGAQDLAYFIRREVKMLKSCGGGAMRKCIRIMECSVRLAKIVYWQNKTRSELLGGDLKGTKLTN